MTNIERAVAALAVPSPSPWQRYRRRVSSVVGFLAPLVVAAVLIPERGSYATPAAALTMVVVVTGVAVVGPRVAGLIASLSAALWFDLFLTHPYGRLTIDRGPELETTIAHVRRGPAHHRGRRAQPPVLGGGARGQPVRRHHPRRGRAGRHGRGHGGGPRAHAARRSPICCT